MGQSVLVFISHSSVDKETFIEPIVADLEACFINVWLDKKRLIPGENLKKSILREGLDKADVVLIFFTERSLKSSWVDKEIKHVLRDEASKGNNFDLNKIISIFDSSETYDQIADRYPELTDDLLHLMPENYSKIQLGQLVSAIWSKYLTLQGGDVATQKQLLQKDKEIFQKEKEIQQLKANIVELKSKNSTVLKEAEFQKLLNTNLLNSFILLKDDLLLDRYVKATENENLADAVSFGLIQIAGNGIHLTNYGREFFQ